MEHAENSKTEELGPLGFALAVVYHAIPLPGAQDRLPEVVALEVLYLEATTLAQLEVVRVILSLVWQEPQEVHEIKDCPDQGAPCFTSCLSVKSFSRRKFEVTIAQCSRKVDLLLSSNVFSYDNASSLRSKFCKGGHHCSLSISVNQQLRAREMHEISVCACREYSN